MKKKINLATVSFQFIVIRLILRSCFLEPGSEGPWLAAENVGDLNFLRSLTGPEN